MLRGCHAQLWSGFRVFGSGIWLRHAGSQVGRAYLLFSIHLSVLMINGFLKSENMLQPICEPEDSGGGNASCINLRM